jgi:putative ABC transport system permease protein
MTTIWQDLRYAVRVLRKAPGFTLVTILVLAIGIGANSAIFSLVDAALLRPLPFRDADRLVLVWERSARQARNRVAPLNFLDWKEQSHAFASLAGVASAPRTLTGLTEQPERIPGQAVTADFFTVLGVAPIAGRAFLPEDAAPTSRVVIVSERFWRNRTGSDPSLLGRTVQLDGQPYTVIGIVPADFQILAPSEMWTLLSPQRTPDQRRSRFLQVIGRLGPNASMQAATTDLTAVADNISRVSPDTNKDWGITIEPLRDALIGTELHTTSLVLAGVAFFVLLMACANVANLLLARGVDRLREIAVRAALGGSRSRIVKQMLTESVLLALLGGVAGLLLGWWMVRVAPSVLPVGTLPEAVLVRFDWRVASFAIVLSVITGIIFGLAPAWHLATASLSETLSHDSRTASGGMGRFRAALVVVEVAGAVLLVTGAGLLVRTLMSLNAVDPGYRAENVLTMYVSVPFNRYKPDQLAAFYDGIEREVAQVPGVRAAALGGNLPLDGSDMGQTFQVVGTPAPPDRANQPLAQYKTVGGRYFQTLGIPILQGRAFNDRDVATGQPVCIVNEEFVRRYLGGRDPLASQIAVRPVVLGPAQPIARQIVGVIGQVKEQVGEDENAVELYVPIAQNPWYSASVVVQTEGNPRNYIGPAKAAIAKVDKNQPVTRVRTIAEIATGAVARPRFRAQLVGTFATMALVLAAVGVFGVLAFSVHRRVREFGLRMALGAQPSDVLRMVLGGAFKVTATGIVIGLIAAALLVKSLSTLLFGVAPFDPLTFIVAPAILALTALIAGAVPAWRAVHVDPVRALRQD